MHYGFAGKTKIDFLLMNWVLSVFSNFYLCFIDISFNGNILIENFKFQAIYLFYFLLYIYT
jgi:hypothetical protein